MRDALAVQLGIDLDPGRAGADDTFDDIENILAQLGLDLTAAFIHDHRPGRLAIGPAGQLAAAIIGDRNAGRRDPGGGSDDIANHPDLLGVQATGGRDGDGGGRRLLVARKQAALGQVQVDAGGIDIVEGLDCPRQLAFRGALGIEVLDEAGLAEAVLAVEDFIADRRAAERAVRGHPHARFINLVTVDIDGRPAFADFIGDVRLVQQLRGRDCFRRVQPGIEQGLAGTAHRAGKIHERGGNTDGQTEDRGQPPGPESPELFKKRVHLEFPASEFALHQRSTGQNFPTCRVNETLRRLHT